MELLWDEFTEENFRKMKRFIVNSANDDNMTMAHIGRVSVGDVHIELYIYEEPDNRFTIYRRYFVGCAGRETDAALINVRPAVDGLSYGEYKMNYIPIEYREDILYDELVRLIEEGPSARRCARTRLQWRARRKRRWLKKSAPSRSFPPRSSKRKCWQ